MGQNISGLERLAEQPHLVAPILYSNPERNKQKFYDFVRAYATQQGMTVNEIRFSLPQDLRRSFDNINAWFARSDVSKFDKALVIGEDISRIILMPVLYPLFGGGWGMRVNGDNIDIAVPQWDGIKPWLVDYKIHEYLHAYNTIMARDLRNRGLITIDGFYDIPNEAVTPLPKQAPTGTDLKRFEKRLIYQIARSQKRR